MSWSALQQARKVVLSARKAGHTIQILVVKVLQVAVDIAHTFKSVLGCPSFEYPHLATVTN